MAELINLRETLLNKIDTFLSGKSFSKESDTYERNVTVQEPGTRMMVNGQVYEQPGTIHNLKFKVLLLGQGSIEDEHGSESFETIQFEIYQELNRVFSTGVCFYYGDFEEFTQVFTKIFKI